MKCAVPFFHQNKNAPTPPDGSYERHSESVRAGQQLSPAATATTDANASTTTTAAAAPTPTKSSPVLLKSGEKKLNGEISN